MDRLGRSQDRRVNEIAITNTARVIRDVNADVLAGVEADNRIALRRFTDPLLRDDAGKPIYPHVMVIDGNDDRGIDVGLLTKPTFPMIGIRSHGRRHRPRRAGVQPGLPRIGASRCPAAGN